MQRLLLALASLALPAGASGPGPRPDEASVAQLVQDEELLASLVERLEEHADWCQRAKLFGHRDTAYERILRVDPDHGTARKNLGYRRRGGEWVLGRTKPARNFDERAALEAPARLAEAVRPYCDALVGRLESGTVDATTAGRLEREVLFHLPAEPRVRARRGEVRAGGEWVLAETLRAAERRLALEELVADALADGAEDPARGQPDEREASFGLDFHVRATDELRVLATSGDDEALELARRIGVARRVFRAALGSPAPLPPGCTVYLMAGPEEGGAFLARHPDLTDSDREGLVRLTGSGIPGSSDWAFWADRPEQRSDGIVRMGFGYFLGAAYRLPYSVGWAHEGLGLYLTKAVLGTRLTWFADPGADAALDLRLRDHLLNPRTNWMREAYGLLAQEPPPSLGPLLAKGRNELGAADLLLSYALAAYLIEGRPDDLPGILTRIGEGAPPERALRDGLGLEVDLLVPRLRQWVAENFSRELAPPVELARLEAAWAGLDDAERTRVLASFRERIAALDTRGLRIVRAQIAREDASSLPRATPAPHYDPKVHARGDPIRRRILEEGDERLVEARRRFLPERDARAPILAWDYDWVERRVVRTGDPADPDTVFRNAANGYPPGFDLARASALRELDGEHHAALLAAFGHAYTDRDGGVYPGITMYDAWATGELMEMPDVDVLGIVHDVTDDWETWVAPLPGEEHEALYAMIEGLYRRARAYRTLREALAETLAGRAPRAAHYARVPVELHALWADAGDRPGKLAERLPDADLQADWFEEWLRRCGADGDLWRAAEDRRTELEAEAEAVVRALEAALRDAGAF